MGNPLRYSLAGLVAVILLVSVYLAMLRNSSTWGAELALTLSIGLLTAGLFWGLFHPRADRWFWVGIQLGGWGYLLVALGGSAQAQLQNYLLTTRLVAALHQQMPLNGTQGVMVEWHGTWYPAEILRRSGARNFIHYTGYGSNWDEWVGPERIRGQLGPFLQISHSLLCLVFALASGTAAGVLGAATRSRRWFWVVWGGLALAIAAISGLAIASDSDLAASAAWSLLLVVLLLAALAARGGSAGERSFALGFAIVGCGYLLLHFGPGLESSLGSSLLSTRLVQQLHEWLHPSPVQPPGPIWTTSSLTSYTMIGVSPAYFRTGYGYSTGEQISACAMAGHSLLATLLSLIAGPVAVWLSRGRGAANTSDPTTQAA